MSDCCLNHETICFTLEEIPDEKDVTDTESEDEPDVRLTDIGNFYRIFQREISGHFSDLGYNKFLPTHNSLSVKDMLIFLCLN